jgi:hypothetical protein
MSILASRQTFVKVDTGSIPQLNKKNPRLIDTIDKLKDLANAKRGK